MPLIYFSSSSPFAETFSSKIASQCQAFLEVKCIISSFDRTIPKKNLKEQIEKCDVLIVVICSDSNPDGEDVSAYNLIDNEKIRFEIICAMNKDIMIIPVLIDADRPELRLADSQSPVPVGISEFTTPDDVTLFQQPLTNGSASGQWSETALENLGDPCADGEFKLKAVDRAGLESNILVLACSEGTPMTSMSNADTAESESSPCCTGAPGHPLLLLLAGLWMFRRRQLSQS